MIQKEGRIQGAIPQICPILLPLVIYGIIRGGAVVFLEIRGRGGEEELLPERNFFCNRAILHLIIDSPNPSTGCLFRDGSRDSSEELERPKDATVSFLEPI